MNSSCQLSIIVCTCNRAAFLQRCLDALIAQSVPETAYEVLVVDNNSTDETASVVARMLPRHPHLRYVREEHQGLSYARNRGMRETASPWVAYVDDDGRFSQTLSMLYIRRSQANPSMRLVGCIIQDILQANHTGSVMNMDQMRIYVHKHVQFQRVHSGSSGVSVRFGDRHLKPLAAFLLIWV